jgi:hypothetical protein
VNPREEIPAEIAISEGELRSMTRSLDEMHQESMSDVRSSMAALSDRISSATGSIANRRVFLLGGAAVVGAGVLAACGSSSSGGTPAATGGTTPTSGGGSPYTGDLKVVALAAALENLAIAGYGLALTNAKKGRYGAVPPAIADFVVTARKQHVDHAAAWNGVLGKAGLPKVTMPSLSIAPGAVSALKGAKKITDVAQIALNLENAAAETYVFATANVTDAGGIATAASIAPVEAMHAAILSFVLGQYPVPQADIGVSNAVQPSALTA